MCAIAAQMAGPNVSNKINQVTDNVDLIDNYSHSLDIGGGRASGYYSFGEDFITLNVDPKTKPHVIADARNLPFAEKTFTRVSSSYLPYKPLVYDEYYSELGRVVRPGGVYSAKTNSISYTTKWRFMKDPVFL